MAIGMPSSRPPGIAGIHPTAILAPGARVHASVRIGEYCQVGPEVSIGPETEIRAHTVIEGRVSIGARNILGSSCVIGGRPQDRSDDGQNSSVFLGDDNRLGRGVTVNRGTLKGGGITTIGSRNRLQMGSHVAHDCSVGDDCELGEHCMLAGHIRMETGSKIDSMCGVHHWVTIGVHSRIRGGTRVNMDVPPFMILGGYRAEVLGVHRERLSLLGVRDAVIADLDDCVSLLWRRGLPKPDAIEKILRVYGGVAEVQTLVAFLQASDRGLLGRALERRPPPVKAG